MISNMKRASQILNGHAKLLTFIFLSLSVFNTVDAHGRLIEPPSRSSAWRYGFKTPANYNDHELYCGGFARQWQRNKGKCGPCGDAYDAPRPRANEAGGTYGKGVIVRQYKKNSAIRIEVDITANHYGYFEFRICPHNNPRKPVTNACLDEHVLQRADGSGHRFYPGPGSRVFRTRYRLPTEMTCKQCVFQWRYVAGNNWGTCANGTGMVGCGPQEQFRACADVTILDVDGSADETPAEFDYDYDFGVAPTDETENEVENDRKTVGTTTTTTTWNNHTGHVVAMVLSFVLAVMFVLSVVLYRYWGRAKVAKVFKRHIAPKKNSSAALSVPPPIVTPHSKTNYGGVADPPQAPPRRGRSSAPPAPPPPPQSSGRPPIRSISPPTSVSINGVAVGAPQKSKRFAS